MAEVREETRDPMKPSNTDYKTDLIGRLKNRDYAMDYLRESFLLSLEDGDGASYQLALRDVAEARLKHKKPY